MKLCSIPGCGDPHKCKGLCNRHYLAERRKDPAIRKRLQESANRWDSAHREDNRIAERLRRAANPESCREAVRKWKRDNPERARELSRAYSRRRRAAGTELILEREVVSAYGTDCHICLTKIDMSAPRLAGSPGWELSFWIDHVIPISKDGKHTLNNLRPSHALCNIIKGNRVDTATEVG